MLVLLAAGLAALAIVAPRGASAAEDEPPTISSAVVTPGSLGPGGGTIQIDAYVEDDIGISNVYAEIYGNEFQAVNLAQVEGDHYRGTANIGPNFSHETIGYQVTVWAVDTNETFTEFYAGEFQVEGEPEFDEPPYVYDTMVSPASLPVGGGPVTIAASAFDLRGISEAYAAVTLPNGEESRVELEPVSSDDFEGTFQAPPNATGSIQSYSVRVAALDDIGQETSVNAGTFTVAAQRTGLTASPRSLHFGPVVIGTASTQSFTLTHGGPKGAKPVSGSIQISGAGFSLPGATAGSINFQLAAGQSATYSVRLRPGKPKLYTGAVSVTRTGASSPAFKVPVSGWGKKGT